MTHRRFWACKQAGGRVQARHPCLLLFLLACALLWDGTGLVRLSLLCVLWHECGHVLAFLLLTGRAPRLEISCLGICLKLRGTMLPPAKELWLAAAGPLANLMGCAAALGGMELAGHWFAAGYWFAAVNLLEGAANLLPLPGLDGHRMMDTLLAMRCEKLHSGQK